MTDTKCIAMLLAGGQGSRLKKLTKDNAKPGVMFGGKYRIIDFSLSNCYHSDIYTIGVLIQYKPLILGRYIGNGSSWALDKIDQGIYILPPYADKGGEKWYRGTAHAVYQNIEFIDMYDPEYVLVLSGDHIYKMDYSEMLDYAEEKAADLMVSVMEVEWKDASRFGIMNLDEDNKIIEFQEKPEEPKNNMASMGIYIFKWKILRDALLRDSKDEKSSHDFGKNIIPMMLEEDRKVYGFPFEGYWRDVGTVESYYEANMDLLEEREDFNLYSKNMRVYSNNINSQPHYAGFYASINNSLICDGCIIEGTVNNSIFSYDVKIGKSAVVRDSIIFSNAEIEEGAVVEKAIIGENMRIKKNKSVGDLNSDDITVVG